MVTRKEVEAVAKAIRIAQKAELVSNEVVSVWNDFYRNWYVGNNCFLKALDDMGMCGRALLDEVRNLSADDFNGRVIFWAPELLRLMVREIDQKGFARADRELKD